MARAVNVSSCTRASSTRPPGRGSRCPCWTAVACHQPLGLLKPEPTTTLPTGSLPTNALPRRRPSPLPPLPPAATIIITVDVLPARFAVSVRPVPRPPPLPSIHLSRCLLSCLLPRFLTSCQ